MTFYKAQQTEKVETTFVICHFFNIQKEMTLFLVVPKRNNQKQQETTRKEPITAESGGMG